MLDELFSRMQIEPCVLLVGKNYRRLNLSILNYAWNAIVTTNCDLSFSASLNNDYRRVTDVISEKDMQANLLDRRNLHVIRLFGEEYPQDDLDELEVEDIVDSAINKLRKISGAIQRNGIVLIENVNEPCFSHKDIRTAFNSLYPGQRQLFIFNCKEKDKYLEDLEKKGIATIIETSINDFFENYFSSDDYSILDDSDQAVRIFVNAGKEGRPVLFERKRLVETDSFATLLNIDLLNQIKVPQDMAQDYFYLFLKNSVREPQWFGYNYGFNIHRHFEDKLYRKTKKGLENVGKKNNRPLLVIGQTGTGKSIALAALAYRVFNEKKYPVIYINDPDINFHLNTEYRQKEVVKKGSQAFNALDLLLESLENMGASATLIIWDTSSYSAGREKSYRLYQALLSRGRKVFLVSSAYELNTETIADEEEEDGVEESVLTNKFSECHANIEVTDEKEQLRNILLSKCGMNGKDVNSILNFYAGNKASFLSMFYQAFDILRLNLSKGVYREANSNMAELDELLKEDISKDEFVNNVFAIALKNAENELVNAGIVSKIDDIDSIEKQKINIAKDDFIKCIAVCSQYKLKVPYDFALRILGTYNETVINVLSKSTFFVISQDFHDNYEISIRTPLEASMYIMAKEMSALDEIDCIVTMLQNMQPSGEYGQQAEVKLCETIIRIIGPNNRSHKKNYKKGYPIIINALRSIREDKNIWEPILIAQEITYLRECYGHDDNLSIEQRTNSLNEAIKIADKVLDRTNIDGLSIGIRNAIIVESANSKLTLCQLNNSKDPSIYTELRRDLRSVIRYDNLNYHAYVTLLKSSITEYQNETDAVKRIQLLESMCSVADEIVFENPEVSNSEFFRRQVAEIYSLLDSTETVDQYVDELVANGSAAGLYVKARKILMENQVDFRNPIEDEMQESACRQVYSWFNDDKYKNVADENEACQYMYLNIVWLLNNRSPIYQSGECWRTSMKMSAWREILNICDNYISRFSDDISSTQQMAKNIHYIKALCLGELEQYSESLLELNRIEEDSNLGLARVYTKHMLCEEDGRIRKFDGRLGKYDELKRSGFVYIEEFGKTPIYYHGPRMKSSDLREGRTFQDIEIGYSNIAPKAFRDVEHDG